MPNRWSQELVARTAHVIIVCSLVGGGLLAAAQGADGGVQARNAGATGGETCAACHEKQAAAMTAEGGAHAALECGDCHAGEHPPKGPDDYTACGACHEGHGETVTQADCRVCHTAHRPRQVAYALDVPAQLCGTCHGDALAQLGATRTRHKLLTCALCHRRTHGATMTCADCHGDPHAGAAVAPSTGCSCHGPAHDLGRPPKGA